MLYTPQIQKALLLAWEGHQGQFDKSGYPYIFHPYHLAEQMPDEESTVVALLHDLLEDTAVTMAELTAAGFSPAVCEAVGLLTHAPAVPYLEYIRALAKNPLARRVKLADLRHNSDPARLLRPTENDRLRMEKYRQALAILLAAEPPNSPQ